MQAAGQRPADRGRRKIPPPSATEMRAQLARIIASPEFVVPERARSFLRYVVEETLAGHADRLKGYTIAVTVFERDAGFDSQTDPVVRIEAGRLRRALERYYLVAGQADPVLIEIPKGGYVPTFTRRPVLTTAVPTAKAPGTDEPPAATTVTEWLSAPFPRWCALALVLAGLAALVAVLVGIPQLRFAQQPAAVPEAAVPEGTSLLVMPFASLSEGNEAKLYAAGLTEEILTQLSRFKELTVLGRETTWSVPATADPGSVTRELAVRYVLVGSLRVSGRQLRVASRLVDARTGAVLWGQTYGEDLRPEDLLSIQEDIASQVVATVAQPYGVVFQADLQKTADQPPDDLEAYACTLRFYVYRAELSPEQHALIRACLEQAVARFPRYATAWAMLSLIDLDEDRFAFNPDPGGPAPIERALAAARRATELDAHSARALQALMMALFFHGDVEEAIGVGERALAANPNDSEFLSEFGLRVALTGAWQRGRELVEQALARNPGHSGYYHAVLALIAYMQRDHDRALAEIQQANLEKFSIYHAVAAIIYAERGLMTEAHHEAARFMELHPTFLANLDAELARRNLRPEDRARLAQGLRKAGLPVPEPGPTHEIRRLNPGALTG
jgi:adenylate cyclase